MWWVSLHRVGDSFFEHSFLNLDILNHRVWLVARVSNPVLVMMCEYLIILRRREGRRSCGRRIPDGDDAPRFTLRRRVRERPVGGR